MKGEAFSPSPRAIALVAYAAVLATMALLVFAFTAPPLRGFAPLSHRLFYFHVPAAILAYAAFAATLASSVAYLATRRARWDLLAASTAEVGVLLATLATLTGLAWARVDFVEYRPLADPKLVSVIALALAYGAYLALRRGLPDEERRARLASVFGIVAFLGVPVAYAATYFGSVHPTPDAVESLRSSLAVSVALLAWLPAALVLVRMRTLDLERRLARRGGR